MNKIPFGAGQIPERSENSFLCKCNVTSMKHLLMQAALHRFLAAKQLWLVPSELPLWPLSDHLPTLKGWTVEILARLESWYFARAI